MNADGRDGPELVEDALVQKLKSFKTKTILYILAMCWGSLTYGYNAAVIGTTLGQPSFLEYMNLLSEPRSTQIASAIVCVYYVGGALGALAAAPLADRYGRKTAIFVGALVTLICEAISTGSVNAAMFIVFRLLVGFGTNILLATIPVWITEIVPPKNRGVLTDIHPIVISGGYFIAGWVGVGFYFLNASGVQWRAPLAVGCLWPLLCMASVPFIPESPRYLLLKGRPDRAWEIVRDLHSHPDDVHHAYARLEFEQMRRQIDLDKTLHVGYLGMLTRKSYLKRVVLGCGLVFLLESSGVLVINIYGTELYRGLGFGPTDVLYFEAGWTTVSFCFNILAITIVDRLPRPWLMTLGFLGCLASMATEAAIQAKYLGSTNTAALSGGVAMLYIFVFFFALFLDGSTFFYIGEIFPNHLRAQGMTLAMFVLNVTNVIWQSSAPTGLASIGWKYYLIFVIFSAIACVVIPTTFPDTRNKPLEEISRLFGDEDQMIDDMQHVRQASAEDDKPQAVRAGV